MVLKEGGLFSLCVGIGVPLPSMVLIRRWTSLCVTGMICSLLMSLGLLYRSSLRDQDSGRSVGEFSLSHSRSMLFWSRSLVRYFFCAVFSSGRADLLEILSLQCSLIKCWMVVIRVVFSLVFILRLMDSVSCHSNICEDLWVDSSYHRGSLC